MHSHPFHLFPPSHPPSPAHVVARSLLTLFLLALAFSLTHTHTRSVSRWALLKTKSICDLSPVSLPFFYEPAFRDRVSHSSGVIADHPGHMPPNVGF